MSSMSQIRHGRVSFVLWLLQGTGCSSQGAPVTSNGPCCYSFNSDGMVNASLTGWQLMLSSQPWFKEQTGLGKARRCLLISFQLILILSQQLTLLSLGLSPDWPQTCRDLPASASLRGTSCQAWLGWESWRPWSRDRVSSTWPRGLRSSDGHVNLGSGSFVGKGTCFPGEWENLGWEQNRAPDWSGQKTEIKGEEKWRSHSASSSSGASAGLGWLSSRWVSKHTPHSCSWDTGSFTWKQRPRKLSDSHLITVEKLNPRRVLARIKYWRKRKSGFVKHWHQWSNRRTRIEIPVLSSPASTSYTWPAFHRTQVSRLPNYLPPKPHRALIFHFGYFFLKSNILVLLQRSQGQGVETMPINI